MIKIIPNQKSPVIVLTQLKNPVLWSPGCISQVISMFSSSLSEMSRLSDKSKAMSLPSLRQLAEKIDKKFNFSLSFLQNTSQPDMESVNIHCADTLGDSQDPVCRSHTCHATDSKVKVKMEGEKYDHGNIPNEKERYALSRIPNEMG